MAGITLIHHPYGMILVGPRPTCTCMSAEQRQPVGMAHMTVVPENFEPRFAVDEERDDDPEPDS